jgi:asparagine synthase (glutamine-hydrolysing)
MELLGGFFCGFEPRTITLREKLEEIGPDATPRRLLEDIARDALQRQPCIISFSGGRDSSAVLAVAVHVARREGLALPVAFTQRYPDAPTTQESQWQERVIGHLGLDDWERVELHADFDAVGSLAQPLMRRFGVTLGQLQMTTVLFGRARGGSYLDGEGGDEVFGFRRATTIKRTLTRPQSLGRPKTYPWLWFHLVPHDARLRNWRRYYGERLEAKAWLRPEPLKEVLEGVAQEFAAEPLDARESLWGHLFKRRVACFRRNRQLIASADYGVSYVQPLLEPAFVAAWARQIGRLGVPDRTSAMRMLFSDLLPDDVLSRSTKAIFNTVFLGEATKHFAESWGGGGVDSSLVDPDALRKIWLSDWPSNLTSGLLQSAWLSENGV